MSAKNELVIGVDSSTQKTLVELRELESGRLVWSGRRPHPATTPPRSEQDPETWWLALSALSEEAATAAAGAPISAIAVAAQQHGMVVLDRSAAVVRPAKLWNDTESAPDAQELVDRLGGPEPWARACGSVPTAAFTITKVAWLERCEPNARRRVAKVLLPHDWLTYRLTGAFVTDRGDASGTGYFSPTDGRWRPDLLDLVGLSEDAVPDVAGGHTVVGTWRDAAVAPGTGDNMAAALGLGLEVGDVVVSIGTSGTVFTRSRQPSCDPSGAVCGFADATGQFLPLVCTLNAAKVGDTFARLLGVDAGGLDDLAMRAIDAGRLGGSGPVLVPYLDGERTPNLPAASGSLVGLRGDAGREDIALAVVLGVVCHLLEARDAISRAGLTLGGDQRLLLVGGAARSPAYRKVLADLAGVPVHVPMLAGDVQLSGAGPDSSVALGAAVQAASVVTQRPTDAIAASWGVSTRVVAEPGSTSRDTADSVRATYRSAARQLADHP